MSDRDLVDRLRCLLRLRWSTVLLALGATLATAYHTFRIWSGPQGNLYVFYWPWYETQVGIAPVTWTDERLLLANLLVGVTAWYLPSAVVRALALVPVDADWTPPLPPELELRPGRAGLVSIAFLAATSIPALDRIALLPAIPLSVVAHYVPPPPYSYLWPVGYVAFSLVWWYLLGGVALGAGRRIEGSRTDQRVSTDVE